jgi:hypothetical protein
MTKTDLENKTKRVLGPSAPKRDLEDPVEIDDAEGRFEVPVGLYDICRRVAGACAVVPSVCGGPVGVRA